MRYFKILVVFLAVITVSCTEDELNPSLCPDGLCDGKVFIPFPKDSNGYYHVDLEFTDQYFPRFDLFIEGDDVDPYYYYNDIGVVQAAAQSDAYWTLENGVTVDLVQDTTIYLNNSPQNTEYTPSSTNRKWAKRIIGPVHPQFIGDTIKINVEIYWDGGSNAKSQFITESIIIE